MFFDPGDLLPRGSAVFFVSLHRQRNFVQDFHLVQQACRLVIQAACFGQGAKAQAVEPFCKQAGRGCTFFTRPPIRRLQNYSGSSSSALR